MARVSFSLRSEDPVDKGSYVRYGASTGELDPGVALYPSGSEYPDGSYPALLDYDSALRADSLQLAPATFSESSFEVTTSCYNEADIGWTVEGLPLAEAFVLPPTPVVTDAVVVYSDQGEPQTLASGDILVESGDVQSYHHGGLAPGRWAYYSLFIRYQSTGGDDYYERVASLSILVPTDYGSTLQLWRRIPEFYRLQDSNMGTTEYPACIGQVDITGRVGPLFKYLSIIGYDMDRMRTVIDYTMGARDPDVAHTEILDALAEQMGVPMRAQDLGASRLRRVLGDIGEYRRTKGTPAALEYLGQAITGGNVEVDVLSGDIKIYSQRVNYITDPKDGTGIISHRAAGNTEITAPVAFASTAFNAASSSYLVTGTSYAPNAPGASAGVNCVMVRINSPVPVRPGDAACFSVHSNVGTDAIKWARLVKVSDSTVIGWALDPTLADGSRAFEIPAFVDRNVFTYDEGGELLLDENGQPVLSEDSWQAPTSPGVGVWTNTYIEFLIDLRLAPSGFVLENMLAELNRLDHYFDGNTRRGGWLIDASSISDYRWQSGVYSSVSLYAEDYTRTNGVLDSMLLDETVPINETGSYQIVAYNSVPGL